MCENKILSKKVILNKLMNNPQISIPRNAKLLKSCCDNWLFENEYPFELAELYELCSTHAKLNGRNAFIRSLISSLLDCKDAIAMDKFFGFVAQNNQQEWIPQLMGSVYLQIIRTDNPFKQRFEDFIKG